MITWNERGSLRPRLIALGRAVFQVRVKGHPGVVVDLGYIGPPLILQEHLRLDAIGLRQAQEQIEMVPLP